MGIVEGESREGYNGKSVKIGCFGSFVRRKRVDFKQSSGSSSGGQLAKALTVPHLVAIGFVLYKAQPFYDCVTGYARVAAFSSAGVGSTIGAGVYILVGTVAREHSGPALALSFLIAGIAAGLSAFCYAELASRCPSAGSAYHYSYICLGESLAWLIGWGLVLEYTVGGSAVARGISPNLALLFGGENGLPFFLARQYIPVIGVTVDPCAALLVFIVTGLLCIGIKESTLAQGIVTTGNVCAMMFVIVAGAYIGFKNGWPGYNLRSGYFPFGVDGVFAGSATVFFAYIGFDSVASTAEEVKNPQRDLPLGIAAALSVCCVLYMLVSMVVVGLVPFYTLDPDTPISSAFASHGIQWAAYIITVGAVTALCSTLMGSLLPQPRILMAMARDGLLPSFFSDVNKKTQVPVKSTVITGIVAALLAFFMDVSQLAGMVSVGTLLAFATVAISLLVIRYVPPDVVPLPSSLQESIQAVSLKYSSFPKDFGNSKDAAEPLLRKAQFPVLLKQVAQGNYELSDNKRRKIAGWTIMLTCVGILLLTSAASCVLLPRMLRYTLCGLGGGLLLSGLTVLTCIDQDDERHNFGHTGGFICPLVPLLPIICILINVYLLINLGSDTWMRVSVWLFIGLLVYLCYGRRHSSLRDALYVPTTHISEICSSSDGAII